MLLLLKSKIYYIFKVTSPTLGVQNGHIETNCIFVTSGKANHLCTRTEIHVHIIANAVEP